MPEMDRWEILIPAVMCNVNQNNEQHITLIQGCISIKSHQVGCIDQNRNIPGLEQLNILEQKYPLIKSQLWDPQTCSRIETLLKDN